MKSIISALILCVILTGCTGADTMSMGVAMGIPDAVAIHNRINTFVGNDPVAYRNAANYLQNIPEAITSYNVDAALQRWAQETRYTPPALSKAEIASMDKISLCGREKIDPRLKAEIKKRKINCILERDKGNKQLAASLSVDQLCSEWYQRSNLPPHVLPIIDQEVKKRGIDCVGVIQTQNQQNQQMIMQQKMLDNQRASQQQMQKILERQPVPQQTHCRTYESFGELHTDCN